MCGLCTKYKRLPLPIPTCRQRGLSLGLPALLCSPARRQLPLGVCQTASEGREGVRLGASPSQTTAGYATVMRPLPGSTSQQSGSRDQLSPLTPDSTGMQQAADFLLSLAAGFFSQDWRVLTLQVLGALFTQHVLDPPSLLLPFL